MLIGCNKFFKIKRINNNLVGIYIIYTIEVNNYQGIIAISSTYANKIEWFLDKQNIKTKYNIVGEFKTTLNIENLNGKGLTFTLFGDGGKASSKTFGLLPQEVL